MNGKEAAVENTNEFCTQANKDDRVPSYGLFSWRHGIQFLPNLPLVYKKGFTWKALLLVAEHCSGSAETVTREQTVHGDMPAEYSD